MNFQRINTCNVKLYKYEHTEIVEAYGTKRHVGSAYTNKLMKYDDYCDMVGITRHEFNNQMTQV